MTARSLDPPPAVAAPRRRASPQVRRAQILEAALGCFSEKGYHAATMDDLAAAAGLSKGSLYWHYTSKEEVFLALFDAFALALWQDWQKLAGAPGNALEELRRQVGIALDRLSERRPLLFAWAEFLTHEVARERFAEVYRLTREQIARSVERGIAAGELRDLHPECVAASLVASVEGLLLQFMVDPAFDLHRHFDVSWRITLGGLRP